MKRRDFIMTTGIAGIGLSVLPTASCNTGPKKDQTITDNGPFSQEELGFAYRDLEPYIDAQTMEIHYSKHHAGYVKKLNAAIQNHPLRGKGLAEIMTSVTGSANDSSLVNNGGGHYNHSLFWKVMRPGGSKNVSGSLEKEIIKQFGSVDSFLKDFTNAAAARFGSGWAWLSVGADKKLFISSTANQENPAMINVVKQAGAPILGIDVWEHAYYLKYQNRRKEYIGNFIKTINWDVVKNSFEAAM